MVVTNVPISALFPDLKKNEIFPVGKKQTENVNGRDKGNLLVSNDGELRTPFIHSVSRMFGGGGVMEDNENINSYSLYINALPKITQKYFSGNEQNNILDLGSGYGLSTLSILSSLKYLQHESNFDFSIDAFDTNKNAVSFAKNMEFHQPWLDSNIDFIPKIGQSYVLRPELHRQVKSSDLRKKLNSQRQILMERLSKILEVNTDNNSLVLGSKVKESEKPTVKTTDKALTNIPESKYNLIQAFGLFPSFDEQVTSKFLSELALKLKPNGVLFSDFPFVNELNSINNKNIFNSGLKLEYIKGEDCNEYPILVKPANC